MVEDEPAEMVRHAIGLGNGFGTQQRNIHLGPFCRDAGARRRDWENGVSVEFAMLALDGSGVKAEIDSNPIFFREGCGREIRRCRRE
jgi:hypothetical protein